MRVLSVGSLYPPHHLGGYELVWRSAVESIRAAGHDVRVLATTTRFADAEAAEDPDVHRTLRWYWRDHAFPRMSLRDRLALERSNAECFDRHVLEFRPDVVNWWAMGGMSLSLVERGRGRGLPAVGVVGDDWMDYGPRADGWLRAIHRVPGPVRAWIESTTGIPTDVDLDHAAAWLFNSARTRDHAVAQGHRFADARVVHPGIDETVFVPYEAAREWRWRLLCAGRIDPRKGIDTAIRALGRLPGEAQLSILGAGDDRHLVELRELAVAEGVDDRVSFGAVSRGEVADAYRAADALLFPVRWAEPWGLVPLEAMACGTPVIATGRGGSAEYLTDGVNCLLYRPVDDPDALAAAVRRLADDAALRSRVRAAGLDTAAPLTASAHDAAVLDALLEAASRP